MSYRFVEADGCAPSHFVPINLTDLLYVRSPAVKPPIPVCSVVQSGASAFSLSCDDNLDFIRSALQLTPSPPPPSVSSSSARRKAVYGRWRVELTTSIAPISWSIEHECFLSAHPIRWQIITSTQRLISYKLSSCFGKRRIDIGARAVWAKLNE